MQPACNCRDGKHGGVPCRAFIQPPTPNPNGPVDQISVTCIFASNGWDNISDGLSIRISDINSAHVIHWNLGRSIKLEGTRWQAAGRM